MTRPSLDVLLRAVRSRRLATALMLVWMGLLLVWIVPFQFYGLPAEQIRNIIYREPFLLWVYAALCVVTVTCVWARVGPSVRRARTVPSPGARARLGGAAVMVPGPWSASRAVDVLRTVGFPRIVEGEEWVWAVRNRWSPLGTVVSHFALVVAVACSAWWILRPAPFVGSAVVAEGERFDGSLASYVETTGAGAPSVAFDLESVSPRFHEDVLLFTNLDCVMTDDSGTRRTVRLGTPWYPSPDVQVALEDFGWTVEVVGGRDATTVVGPDVYKLQVFPPGSADYIELAMADARYRLKVVVYGDYADRDGEPGIASYNLRNPRIGLTVWRVLSNDDPLLVFRDRLVAPGEQVDVSPRDSIVFTDVGTYGKFRISRTFPAPLVVAIGLTMFAGFASRLVVPRAEVVLSRGAQGVEIRARRELYGSSDAIATQIADSWRKGSS